MNKSIKTALLFSTLLVGAVEAPAVVNHNVNTAIVAHADGNQDNSTSEITKVLNSNDGQKIANILLSAIKSQGIDTSNTDPAKITNSELQQITEINYTGANETINNFSSLVQDGNLLLPNLKQVSISNVDLSHADLSTFSQYNQIQSITLTGDNLTGSSFNTLKNWNDTDLTDLDVSNNQIDSIDILNHINIPNIQNINISQNRLTDISPIASSNAKNWQHINSIDVSQNQINNIDAFGEVSWPAFTNLNANNNKISDISAISTASLPNLQTLSADNNLISNINAFANTNWSNLTSISANNNFISDVSSLKGKSSKYPNLTTFKVSNNKLSDISWMEGFKFSINSEAKGQAPSIDVTLEKPAKGNWSDNVSVPLSDVTLDNNLLASKDSTGNNFEITNVTLDGQTLGSNLYGFTSNGNNNDVLTFNIPYTGTEKSTLRFHFDTDLGINQNSYYYGDYTANVTWKDKSATNNSGSNNSSSNNTESTNSNNGSGNTGVVDDHSNNSGTPTSGNTTQSSTSDTDTTVDYHKNNAGKPTVTYGKVIATRGLNLYRKNAFTKKNKIKSFKKAYGTNRPLFKVLKKVTSSVNTPRYYVVQINPRTNKEIKGSRGYITAKSSYVTPLYYSKGVKSVKVLSKTVTSYKKVNLKDAVKKYKRGTVLKVKSIKKNGNAYALQLQNGKFVTANKYFVVKVK